MASITFRKVVKQYDGVKEPTVKGIDLSIKDKEFVVLVGGSVRQNCYIYSHMQ